MQGFLYISELMTKNVYLIKSKTYEKKRVKSIGRGDTIYEQLTDNLRIHRISPLELMCCKTQKTAGDLTINCSVSQKTAIVTKIDLITGRAT